MGGGALERECVLKSGTHIHIVLWCCREAESGSFLPVRDPNEFHGRGGNAKKAKRQRHMKAGLERGGLANKATAEAEQKATTRCVCVCVCVIHVLPAALNHPLSNQPLLTHHHPAPLPSDAPLHHQCHHSLLRPHIMLQDPALHPATLPGDHLHQSLTHSPAMIIAVSNDG